VSLSLILRNITLSATHSKSRILDKSQYLMIPFPLSAKLLAVFNENNFLAKENIRDI